MRLLIAVLAFVLGLTAVAVAAPSAGQPPRVAGKPNYRQVLTCRNGTWTGSPTSFSYSWAIGAQPVATGPHYRVPVTAIGYSVHCTVTARDAAGATTSADSAEVRIGQGLTSVRITRVTTAHGKIVITGRASPRASTRGRGGYGIVTLDRRLPDHSLLQLGAPVKVGRDGSFRAAAADHGRHHYIVSYVPADTSADMTAQAKTRLVRIKR